MLHKEKAIQRKLLAKLEEAENKRYQDIVEEYMKERPQSAKTARRKMRRFADIEDGTRFVMTYKKANLAYTKTNGKLVRDIDGAEYTTFNMAIKHWKSEMNDTTGFGSAWLCFKEVLDTNDCAISEDIVLSIGRALMLDAEIWEEEKKAMYFAMTIGEPTYEERARENNTLINDIITFQNKEKTERYYGRVDRVVSRGVKITPLRFDGRGFIPMDIIIPGTRNMPYFKRDMRIVRIVV